MQDAAVVAAIVADNPDGFAAAYDQYAVSLYTYCSFMLSSPDDAAAAVRDTFLIASSQLPKLRDPGKLRAWLHAVARNECLRRLSAAGDTSRPPKTPGDGALPAIELPAALRGEVLAACADNTPAGRADRATVAHHAGTFGPSGFPKAIGSSAPQWWQQLRRRPRIAAAVVTVAVAAVMGALLATATVAGPHGAQASTVANGSKVPGGSHVASGSPGVPGASARGGASSPGHPQASPGPGTPTPSVTALGGVTSPAPASSGHGTSKPPETPSGTSASPTPSSSSSSPSPSPSAPTSPSPAQGFLQVTPDKLALSATSGKAVSGTFLLSAVNGPVSNYVISVPAAVASKVKVTPATGSVPAGGWVTITVTVTSKTALSTSLTINPGKHAVTVTLSIKR